MSHADSSGDTPQENYYAFLNVSRDATADEIRNAFRSLSRQFHPDKHGANPALKQQAELMFDRLKKAYDVLIDPDKRAIYDAVGVSGLQHDGWALVEKKFKSSKEIKEEYEQLLKEKEQRLMQQRTSPKGSFTVLIDATNLFQEVEDFDPDAGEGAVVISPFSIEVRSMTIAQSIESPLTLNNHVMLNGVINVRNGLGSGTIAVALRHIFNPKTWGEIELGGGNGPMITLKGFRTITPNLHASSNVSLHFSPYGIRGGFNFMLTRQFSKHLVGYLSYKAGDSSSISTTVVFENEYCRLNGSVQVGHRNSFISSSYTHKFQDDNNSRVKVGVKLGVLGAIFDYGCETKVSQFSTLGAALTIGSATGVSLRIRLLRHQQSYIFPILLSEEVIPTSIFYGTLVPLLTYYLVKNFIIDPYLKRQEQIEIERLKETNVTQLDENRKQARAFIELMNDFYQRIIEREQTDGLIIEKALYGEENAVLQYENDDNSIPQDADVFDFKVALQVLVRDDSKLILQPASKFYLPGFFDPHVGGSKKLLIIYRFKNRSHRVLLADNEGAILPSEKHRTSS